MLFRETDKEIIFTMYLLGGKAPATELAKIHRLYSSSYNTPVVNLAKRIITLLDIEAIS